MTKKSQTLSRRDLFDLVWSTPVTKLAGDFGMSDRGFSKLCTRHKVPTPPRGYWARIEAGAEPQIPPFLELRDRSLDVVRINSAFHALPSDVRDAIEERKSVRSRPTKRKAAQASETLPTFDKPHRSVSPVIRKVRRSKPDDDGRVAVMGPRKHGVSVHFTSVERAVSILDAMARKAAERGLEVECDGMDLSVSLGQDKVPFGLVEKTRREKHVPTREELAKEEKRKARLRRNDWDSFDFSFGRPWPEYDTVFTGQLSFGVDVWADGLRKTWADGKTQRVEKLIPDIVDGLELLLLHEKARREESEERARKAEILRHRRYLAKLRSDREEARVSLMRELVDLRREANDIRAWLADMSKETRANANGNLGRMIDWAEARLADLASKTTVGAAEAKMDGRDLFPEINDLEDPEGEPPPPGLYGW